MTDGSATGAPPDRTGLAGWRGLLARRWPWGVAVALGVLGVVAAVLLLSHPVYRAEARLRLGEPPPPGGVSPTTGILSFLRPGGDPFANDLELLSSRTLVERVVREAALSATLDAPRGWHRDSLFLALAVQDSTVDATWSLVWEPAGVVVRMSAPRDSAVGTFAPGEPASFGGVAAVFRDPGPDAPRAVSLETLPLDEAVRITSGRLVAERTRREANVLGLEYRSPDPGLAQRVVEATVRSFLDLRSTLFQRESGETVDSLRTVARETQVELRAAEDALEAMQSRTGLVAPEPQSEVLIGRYEELVGELEAARAERALLATQLARVEAAVDPLDAWTALVAAPAFLENPTVGDLLTRLTRLAEARTELLSVRTPESREARSLEERIDQLDRALRALAREYRLGLDETVAELQVRVDALEGRLEALPADVVELGRRQRDVRLLSELLVLTEQRLRQEELREALSFSTVQVIDPPAVRYRPVWPRTRLGLAVGMLLALGSGTLAMVLVERSDGSVRRATGVRALTGAPVLAAPVLVGGRVALAPGEAAAIRRHVGQPAAVVACPGALDDARGVADALTPGREPVEVAAWTGADGDGVVLVARAGETPARALGRTAGRLRETGTRVLGTVLTCGDERTAEAIWD